MPRAEIRSRWRAATALMATAPLFLVLLAVSPGDEVQASRTVLLLTAAGFAVAVGLFAAVGWRLGGRDRVVVTDTGIVVTRRTRGTRELAWADCLELGWAHRGGLAGRLREGGAYEPGGPHIAGWLARPIGHLRPPRAALDELRLRCEQHGVVWRDYAGAEVS